MPSVYTVITIMLSVIMMSVIMLSVVASDPNPILTGS